MEKEIDIKDKYSRELQDINYILQNLEMGRYYENTGAKMDGYLATNIQKLRDSILSLIDKIEYNKDSISEELLKTLNKTRFLK